MKKIKIFLICTFVVLSGSIAYADSFTDVSEEHLNYNAIEFLKSGEIVGGYDNGTFKPDNNVNRVEALKIILEGSNIPIREEFDETPFVDVNEEDWFYNYVYTAYELDIVKGYGEDEFQPQNELNLAEALKIITLVNNFSLVTYHPTGNVYNDVPNDVWYSTYAMFGKDKNLIEPYDDGNLSADRIMTRGTLSELMFRVIKVKENSLEPFDLSLSFRELSRSNFKIKFPPAWDAYLFDNQTVFWKPDTENNQLNFVRTYPNSARVFVYLDTNDEDLNKDDYFNKVKDLNNTIYHDAELSYQSITFQENPALVARATRDIENINDLYVYLPDGNVFVFESSYGNGNVTPLIEDYLVAIQNSFEYGEFEDSDIGDDGGNGSDGDEGGEGGEGSEDLLTELRENILVVDIAQEMLDKFADVELYETDSIGLGNGPVDYYYVYDIDYTVKVERDTDIILDIREGETDAF